MAIFLSYVLFFFHEMEILAFPVGAKSLELRESGVVLYLYFTGYQSC